MKNKKQKKCPTCKGSGRVPLPPAWPRLHTYYTDCLLVEGATGVVLYGEISIPHQIQPGHRVMKGQYIGNVKRVLRDGKERPDIMGHSTSMLHMELYPHGFYKASKGFENHLDDVTPHLLEAEGCPSKMLTV